MTNLSFSLFRIFIFLFFTGVYGFLSFWIAFTLVFFLPFSIAGAIAYILIALFHQMISIVIETKPGELKNPSLELFLIIAIIFTIGYILGVYWMQGLVIEFLKIPKLLFSIVNYALSGISLVISFALSFLVRKAKIKKTSA